MKNILAIAILLISIFAVSCGHKENAASSKPVEATQTEETIQPDEVVEICDSCTSDSTEVVTRSGNQSEGFGRCSVSGCNCKEFEGRGQTCRNCGHAYKKHY